MLKCFGYIRLPLLEDITHHLLFKIAGCNLTNVRGLLPCCSCQKNQSCDYYFFQGTSGSWDQLSHLGFSVSKILRTLDRSPFPPSCDIALQPQGYQVPVSATFAQLLGGMTHLPGWPESRLGRKGESVSSGRTRTAACSRPPRPGLVHSVTSLLCPQKARWQRQL